MLHVVVYDRSNMVCVWCMKRDNMVCVWCMKRDNMVCVVCMIHHTMVCTWCVCGVWNVTIPTPWTWCVWCMKRDNMVCVWCMIRHTMVCVMYGTLEHGTQRPTPKHKDTRTQMQSASQESLLYLMQGRITLQHAATRCNTLQHNTAHCSTLQHTAMYCNTLQSIASQWTHCNTGIGVVFDALIFTTTPRTTLQHTVLHCNTLQQRGERYTKCRRASYCRQPTDMYTHGTTLHHTAPHCTTLHHTATYCNALQRTATHCNTLQHRSQHCTWCRGASHCRQRTSTFHVAKLCSWSVKATKKWREKCLLRCVVVCCSVRSLLHCVCCSVS